VKTISAVQETIISDIH